MKAIGITLILFLFCPWAFGANTSGEYASRGPGTMSCGSVVASLEAKDTTSYMVTSWLAGYTTAFNTWADEKTYDIAKGTDIHGIELWIKNYCSANPLDDLDTATHKLILEFRHRGN